MKKLLVGIGFFSIWSKFSTKINDSKLHRLSLHHINKFLKNIVEGILKNLFFFNLFINPFPLSHMQEFNRIAKLGHKYAELANINKIFSTVPGNADKKWLRRRHFTKGDRERFTKGNISSF